VDELHEVLGCNILADAVALVSAQHVWGLSGTLPTATTGDVEKIAALFGVSMPIDEINAGRFLDCYVRRNAATEVEDIPVDEHRHVVRPTVMERALYLACQHDFDLPLAGPEAHRGYVPAFLTTWRGLQEHGRQAALVKLCCHHQATASDVELLSTPAQSVQRLGVWKRHHCEEARSLIKRHAALAEWMARNIGPPEDHGKQHINPELPSPEQQHCGSESHRDAWSAASADIAWATGLDDKALNSVCGKDLEVTPFAVCDCPAEAEARWLEWCEVAGLAPGTRGAISRLRKIMYDELWGRLVDGSEGWAALGRMPNRAWQADYTAAEVSKLMDSVADYASSLRSVRYLEAVVRQAELSELECGICLQPLSQPHMAPCAHIFCLPCIERSLQTRPECPQCREPVPRGSNQLSALLMPSGKHAAACPSDEDTVGKGGEFGSKIMALVARLQTIQAQGEKAVVFAQWQDLIFKIHAALAKCGVPAAVLAGGAFDRASVLQRFEAPELPVLLLSLEDSASGTNMAHANHVVLVHPMVASSAEEKIAYESQAIGRVRRWGQRHRVQVWRFVMDGTIEAVLAQAHHEAPSRQPSHFECCGQESLPAHADLMSTLL